MTPDAKELAEAIVKSQEKCGKLVNIILDALDVAEIGTQRIVQENPNCTINDINDIMAYILKASDAVEIGSILLGLALQKLDKATAGSVQCPDLW